MKKKRFVTIFPYAENIHLIKDVGMISYVFNKHYNFHGEILLSGQKEYPYLETILSDMNYSKAPTLFKNDTLNMLVWLFLNARKIDVLHMFHQAVRTQIFIVLYKLLNPKGKIYIHLDTDSTTYDQMKIDLKSSKIRGLIKPFVYHKIIFPERVCKDIVWGCQNEDLTANLSGKFPYTHTVFSPNGYIDIITSHNSIPKENIILTVGRLGTAQKRTDLLLDGFKAVSDILPEWNLRLVGSVEPKFQPYIDNFFEQNPELKNRIFFVGEIHDRKKLFEEFRRSKIFCLPSDYESFGLVNLEALAEGCALVTTGYPVAYILTANETYGKIFKFGNAVELAEKLEEVAQPEWHTDEKIEQRKQFVRTKFSYDKVLYGVNEQLNALFERDKQ